MTLVELLMVMVVMAIMLSIALPVVNSMAKGADMRGAVSNVRVALSQARQWAITHREQVTLRCFPQPALTNKAYFYMTNSAGVYLQATNTLPLTINFDGEYSVTFKTDGALAGGALPANIVLVNNIGARKEIEVNALTGGIRVE